MNDIAVVYYRPPNQAKEIDKHFANQLQYPFSSDDMAITHEEGGCISDWCLSCDHSALCDPARSPGS